MKSKWESSDSCHAPPEVFRGSFFSVTSAEMRKILPIWRSAQCDVTKSRLMTTFPRPGWNRRSVCFSSKSDKFLSHQRSVCERNRQPPQQKKKKEKKHFRDFWGGEKKFKDFSRRLLKIGAVYICDDSAIAESMLWNSLKIPLTSRQKNVVEVCSTVKRQGPLRRCCAWFELFVLTGSESR